MEDSKRQLAFYAYSKAVQAALGSLPDSAKVLLEDLYSKYQTACAEEGFEYEEGWEFPFWNKPEILTYTKETGADWEIDETYCNNEPQEGLAFLCNLLVRAMPERTEKSFDSFGKALAEFVQAEETPEAEAKLAEAVSENQTALNRAGFAVFVPKEKEEKKSFKEIKPATLN